MSYYETTEIVELIKQAYEGNAKARETLRTINVPYAISNDFSEMILVQKKRVDICNEGLIQIRNEAPTKGSEVLQVADIYQCDNEGSSWVSTPIPSCFTVKKLEIADGVFSFISKDNKTTEGTISQINVSMLDVMFTINGVTEEEIEQCFLNISTTVINTPKLQKKSSENANIEHNTIGTFIFDKRHQWFVKNYQTPKYKLELVINTFNRKSAKRMLPIIHKILNKLDVINLNAREFASKKLLEVKNNDWLEDGEGFITKDDFISSMLIYTIIFNEKGDFELWYNDDSLFGGHDITIYINKKGKPKRAVISG
ncbi:DUF2262 domain-containing protein [Cytobacillus sp. IB215316]|uniref:DUF2262 domain-containing protein n=1 Tax=Cytobacillus sp. IB215316 TaxID=3097354 RepID=UPI002A0E6336|nr:DUF2262 domain-containing protein [Cytobacillus sp. IB215316]MDX8363030.1 DUF2262 domain-containing protein [Cytobacillus sp. IB215316]